MTTALVDYDSGNLHSAQKAFERMAAEVGAGPIVVTSDPDMVAKADRIVLPGRAVCPDRVGRSDCGGCDNSRAAFLWDLRRYADDGHNRP